MGYKKGAEVLPAHLLKEVQKYIDGGLIYIPKKSNRVGWGNLNGSKKLLEKRNEMIYELYKNNTPIDELANMYYLSEETIRKIIYGKKQL
ncbi:CD3324 family protein [Tissierella sp. Yu-01]|uniref:CD3324 family protein n=1 Tax=Tissierella sp. Yu-01 TaxID=3035694 RepID=UPI00240D1C2C|nr:CD3324 family protein [Tissierella sp. Yu-01]WFA08027.1 CD3324 family protein [Tissierella sp. Yu-01]